MIGAQSSLPDNRNRTSCKHLLVWLTALLLSLLCVTACTPTTVKYGGSRPSTEDAGDSEIDDTNTATDAVSNNSGSAEGSPCDAEDYASCADGLFCAALDGKPAQCVPEHTREDGKSCKNDLQCVSHRCNIETERCSSSPNAACTLAEGCGPGTSDEINYVCTAGTCKPSNGGNDTSCTWSYDCQSGICKDNKCVSGATGSSCTIPEECDSQVCVSGTCSDGDIGDACEKDPDCNSGNCSEKTCQQASNGPGGSCVTDQDCDEGRCINEQCSSGAMGGSCEATSDCKTGLSCDRQCPEFHCPSTCTDGKKGSPCTSNDGCQNEMRCTDDTPWQPTGAPLALNSCSDEETCNFHLSDCDDENDWCLRTANGPICGRPGTGRALSACTDDTNCSSGVCSDHGFGNFKCSEINGWEAPCTIFSVPGEPVQTIGCTNKFSCDTTKGPPEAEVMEFGYCGALPGHICYFKHGNTTFDHRGGCAIDGLDGCKPPADGKKHCEGKPTKSCNNDDDCIGQATGTRCVTEYACR